ncbi:hypothetical protein Salat_0861900 [Sesamum alatum]|uniref:Uncharacterized protein n=1 Tax=Sesamum alatum TaxID=300844 RepID=A0AAE2CR04_9LAMI|nr:hypothetical protein Salat_0861900 [Sesamum alatum]
MWVLDESCEGLIRDSWYQSDVLGDQDRVWDFSWVGRQIKKVGGQIQELQQRCVTEKLISPPIEAHREEKVERLIDPRTRSWTVDRLDRLFVEEDVESILSIPSSASESEDVFIWYYSKNGLFTGGMATYMDSASSAERHSICVESASLGFAQSPLDIGNSGARNSEGVGDGCVQAVGWDGGRQVSHLLLGIVMKSKQDSGSGNWDVAFVGGFECGQGAECVYAGKIQCSGAE